MTDIPRQQDLGLQETGPIDNVEEYRFEPIKGYPMLHWRGKRPFNSTVYYPAQHRETYGETVNGWRNKIYWGDNLQVMSHLLQLYRSEVKLIYIDPPFDSKADYKMEIKLKGSTVTNDRSAFEEKQYTDIWTNDEYLQFMYERLILMRELLAEDGCIYVHCDYRKAHQIRCLLDEVFGEGNFLNSLVWIFTTRSSIKASWKRTHHDILMYKKSKNPVFNWDDEMVLVPLSESTIQKYKFEDENGRYRLNGRFIKNSPIKGAKDVDRKWEESNPELVVRDYLREGKVPNDYLMIDIENQASPKRTNYPTQKPEELLFKLISASTNPGDLVFDCFMGSGTTQAVAMKLGRRFIGADINLGSIQTVSNRLVKVSKELEEQNQQQKLKLDTNNEEVQVYYSGFDVYNVNHYDIFRNPAEAKDILLEALEVNRLQVGHLFDGEKDGRMVKVMPINRIATRQDLNELINGFDYKSFERRQGERPTQPVERITLVCMGHEPGLAAHLQQEVPYKLHVEVVDILRDKQDLQFKRDSEARVIVEDGYLIIDRFYPMNLLSKLSMETGSVTDWRELVESVMIDWNYDGAVLQPMILDIPDDDELVAGRYRIPDDAGTIRVKITDLLSESLEVEVRYG